MLPLSSAPAHPDGDAPRPRAKNYFFVLVVAFLAAGFLAAAFLAGAFFVAMALVPPFLNGEFTGREFCRQSFFLDVFTFFTLHEGTLRPHGGAAPKRAVDAHQRADRRDHGEVSPPALRATSPVNGGGKA